MARRSYLEDQVASRYLEENHDVKPIHEIAQEMRLISALTLLVVLIVLQRVSRNITRPIIALAEASKKVGAGIYEAPQICIKSNDEVGELARSFNEMIEGLRVLNKVVAPSIAHQIMTNGVKLGGEERRVTVLFADIRHFTQMSSHMTPEETVKLLNTCMTKMAGAIDKHGGVIDKFVGDEVMALFGALFRCSMLLSLL